MVSTLKVSAPAKSALIDKIKIDRKKHAEAKANAIEGAKKEIETLNTCQSGWSPIEIGPTKHY
jgi:hypothetical protein